MGRQSEGGKRTIYLTQHSQSHVVFCSSSCMPLPYENNLSHSALAGFASIQSGIKLHSAMPVALLSQILALKNRGPSIQLCRSHISWQTVVYFLFFIVT